MTSCDLVEALYTGWRKINRTIQTVNRIYENLRKIRPFTLVAHIWDKQEEKIKCAFKYYLLPYIQKLSGNNFTFQQDVAPAHRSRQTVAFLHLHVPEFVEPENWPPNSPDLNLVDYSICGTLQQLAYRRRH